MKPTALEDVAELLAAAREMDAAVAEFLNADVAWTNDEYDEAVVVAAISACKSALYRLRAAIAKAEQPQ